jgi:ATP-dependent protease ClpP protease subunit
MIKDEAYLKNEKMLNTLIFFNQDLHLPSRTIMMTSDPYDGESYLSADQVSNTIRSLHLMEQESTEEITILMSSFGGDAYTGFAVYDAISNSKCHITIKVLGHCMSMGTIVLQAADQRLAFPNATFMIPSNCREPKLKNFALKTITLILKRL